MEQEAAPPTPEAIEALVQFLPVFESAGFNPGRLGSFKRTEDGALTLPEYRYSEAVQAFVEAVYRNGWVIDFAWMEWDEGQRLCDDPELLAKADLPTIRCLLTAHVRCERFNDGHLATMFETGHMVALLKRLRELGEEVEPDDVYARARSSAATRALNVSESSQPYQSDFIAFCEDLWKQWTTNSLSVSPEVQRVFDLEHAPEPYLLFGEGRSPLYVLLTNPGQPMPIQHRSELSANPRYGILRNGSYAQNARALGDFYDSLEFRDFPGMTAGPAYNRLQKLLTFAKMLGHDSVVQVESLPFHSHSLSGKDRVIRLAQIDRLLRQYVDHLGAFLVDKPVFSVSGCILAALNDEDDRPAQPSNWMFWIAERMGLRFTSAELHPIVQRRGPNGSRITGAFYLDASSTAPKGIYAVVGNNNLPAKKGLERMAEIWQSNSRVAW